MAVFEVTREYLEEFVDAQIEKNQEFRDFREDLIDMLTSNTVDSSDFALEDIRDENSWPYEKKEPTQLYIRDSRYHIRIKDVVVDFLENVLSGALLDAMLHYFGLSSGAEASLKDITVDFILFVKRVIKEYVVKLDNTEFCIYLQIITHLKEHQEFSAEEIKGWLPAGVGRRCNMPTDKWACPDLNDGACGFDADKLNKILEKMEKKNIIDCLGNSTYKINF